MITDQERWISRVIVMHSYTGCTRAHPLGSRACFLPLPAIRLPDMAETEHFVFGTETVHSPVCKSACDAMNSVFEKTPSVVSDTSDGIVCEVVVSSGRTVTNEDFAELVHRTGRILNIGLSATSDHRMRVSVSALAGTRSVCGARSLVGTALATSVAFGMAAAALIIQWRCLG